VIATPSGSRLAASLPSGMHARSLAALCVVAACPLAACQGEISGGGGDPARPDAAPGRPDAAPNPGDPDAAPDPGDPDASVGGNPLTGIGDVELVDDGYAFTEGPQWVAATGTMLFSDIPPSRIHSIVPPSTTVGLFRGNTNRTNGLGLLPDGRLIAAEGGLRRITVTETDGDITSIADDYQGGRFNTPNDVIALADGTVYFTDPGYDADDGVRFHGVFRVPPGGDSVAEWQGTLQQRPNGIALSPDQRFLYVADTQDGVVRRWAVGADGALSGLEEISDDVPGADGMAVDAAGNLFVTVFDGVRVLRPSGETWGTITTDEQPTNCAFGDADLRTLYMTARTSVFKVRLAGVGLP
jgi:gluconolactonase